MYRGTRLPRVLRHVPTLRPLYHAAQESIDVLTGIVGVQTYPYPVCAFRNRRPGDWACVEAPNAEMRRERTRVRCQHGDDRGWERRWVRICLWMRDGEMRWKEEQSGRYLMCSQFSAECFKEVTAQIQELPGELR